MSNTLSARRQRLVVGLAAAALTLTLVPGTASQAQQPPQLPIEGGDGPDVTEFEGETGTIVERSGDGLVPSFRYRGVGRHDTARLIALDGRTFRAQDPNAFRDADDVIVARADDFPDSMAGATLAGAVTAPVLLVDTAGEVHADTQAALDTIEPSRVFALGGTAAISEQVVGDLDELAYVEDVERIAGADRFETAAEVARAAADEEPIPEVVDETVALLATGEDFADALTGGQVAYDGPFPLLLTASDDLAQPAEDALADLEVDRVLVLGGSAAVSADVVDTLEALDYDVERLAGRDRTVTAVEIAEFALDELDFSDEHVNVARGNDFADALAVASHAGEERQPLLITATQGAFGQQEAVDFYTDRGCTIEDLHVSGGFAAIETPLEQQVREVATGAACAIEVVTEDQTVEPDATVDVEADVLTSLGETATAGIDVAFDAEAVALGDDEAACDPAAAQTDDDGRATCFFAAAEDGLYEVTATLTTVEGDEVSDAVLIAVGDVGLPDDGDGVDLDDLLDADEPEAGEDDDTGEGLLD